MTRGSSTYTTRAATGSRGGEQTTSKVHDGRIVKEEPGSIETSEVALTVLRRSPAATLSTQHDGKSLLQAATDDSPQANTRLDAESLTIAVKAEIDPRGKRVKLPLWLEGRMIMETKTAMTTDADSPPVGVKEETKTGDSLAKKDTTDEEGNYLAMEAAFKVLQLCKPFDVKFSKAAFIGSEPSLLSTDHSLWPNPAWGRRDPLGLVTYANHIKLNCGVCHTPVSGPKAKSGIDGHNTCLEGMGGDPCPVMVCHICNKAYHACCWWQHWWDSNPRQPRLFYGFGMYTCRMEAYVAKYLGEQDGKNVYLLLAV